MKANTVLQLNRQNAPEWGIAGKLEDSTFTKY